MKKHLRKLCLTGSLGALVALPIAASANLVNDGTFTAAGTPSAYQTYSATSTMGGWTVTAGSVDLIGGYWQSPPGGGNSVDLAGGTSGTIDQTISGLVSGQEYELTFYLSGNPDGAPTTKDLGVGLTLGGASPFAFSYSIGSNTRSNMKYQFETADFVATGISEILQFQDQSSYNGVTPYGAVIGDVSLTAIPGGSTVPEASTMVAGVLMLLPLGVSAMRIMRKGRIA